MIKRLIFILKMIPIVLILFPLSMLMIGLIYFLSPIYWLITGEGINTQDFLSYLDKFIPDEPK